MDSCSVFLFGVREGVRVLEREQLPDSSPDELELTDLELDVIVSCVSGIVSLCSAAEALFLLPLLACNA